MKTRVTQFLHKNKPNLKDQTEQGFTLIESLMGVVVISIVIVAITPPIFLSVATRVQNRRAEQATQLAQGEIDRIRVVVERGKYTANNLPPVAANSSSNITTASAPTTAVNPPTIPTATQALRVDINKDGSYDFLVQTFRDNGISLSGTNALPIAFRMGVRVYSTAAEDNISNLESPPQQAASLRFTTGEGSQRSRPLAVLDTLVTRSDSSVSLNRYRTYLDQ